MGSLNSAWKIIPMFHSLSIAKTVDFYTEKLNFELGGTHSTPRGAAESGNNHEPSASSQTGQEPESTFASVFAGPKAAANIYFCKVSKLEFHPSQAMIAMGTTELDQFYEYVVKLGREIVEIVEPLEDKPWGYRQFTIKDVDGNRLTFFKFLEGGNPGTE